ncbi:MAG: SDR family oxidoreductase [Azospirillaceae bacterium]|nr:SDR family oxidoreductase [Azospirillaceae bacterium]
MDLGLSGRRAIVLGSSRGLGFASARSLAAEGAHVTLTGRNADRLAAARAELAATGAAVEAVSLDVSDHAGLAAALDHLLERTGFDILVNNSGGPAPGPIAAVDTERWRQEFDAMVASLFFVTERLLPAMRTRKWGRIINIASSGVVQPIPNLGVSNSLRAAVVGWAKTLAGEVAADGVTVNTVLPGRIDTERVGELDAAAAKRTGRSVDEVAADSRKTIPVGRYGDPGEFGDVVAFLASTRASFITGSVIRVDGGMIRSI